MKFDEQRGLTPFRFSGDVGAKLSALTNSGSNSSGFTGLLAGNIGIDGISYNRGIRGYFWSSTYDSVNSKYFVRIIVQSESGVQRPGFDPEWGLSVRCLKD